MSVQSSSVSLSKEMSVEESYSKTSVSSSTKMLSSRMESQESITSSTMGSILGKTTSGDNDMTSLVSKMESDLSLASDGILTGSKMSSMEKSSSVLESESSLSYKKSEMSSTSEESSTMMSTKKEAIMKMSSEEVSKTAISSKSYSESISSEATEEKDKETYVVIMDYNPRENDYEGLRVREGQEVEIVDSSKAHKWRVRLKKSGLEGTVPSCYMEKKGAVTPPVSPQLDPKIQAATARREKVLKELVESEEAFGRDMQFVVNNYMKEMESKKMPKELRDYKDALFTNFKAITEFHNNVLNKGIQYYINEPTRLGNTFLRLERDFDMHIAYCKNEPEAQQLLSGGDLKHYFDEYSQKIHDEKSLSEHLKLPIMRINDYQLLLKELIKYTARLKEDTTDLEKALDFMQAIPQRIADLQYLNSIQGYKGNLHKLGRILKHDWFEIIESTGMKRERFLFLFKGRIFVTDHKRVGTNQSIFLVKNVIKLSEVEIVDNADDDELKLRFQSLKKDQSGYPLTIKAASLIQKAEWLDAIQVSSTPQALEDFGPEEELEFEECKTKPEPELKVEVLEDFEAYEEMHTVVTESVRSGSLTSLEEGTQAILECEICSTPDAKVQWLKDNSALSETQKSVVEAEGGKHRLIIKKTTASDAGLYTIVATNVNGTISCSAPLAVHSAPETLPPTKPDGTVMPYGPVFLEKLRDLDLQEDTSLRACVVVQGEPEPKVKFYKGDEEIQSQGHIRFSKESKDTYELIIDNVKVEDAGKYSCVATSNAGQNITACHFTVTKKPIVMMPDDDMEKVSTPDVLEHDNLLLRDVREENGEIAESSERFKVEIDEMEDTVSLVFQHVTPDDSGMYTCVASTTGGKISCSAELTVQGGLPREPEVPKATASTKEVVAKEGESALLELTATGFPKPKVVWSKDGEEIKPNEKYALLQEDDESFTVAIKNVTPEDSGNYAALAKNELGESEVSYKLRVNSPPRFTKPMKDLNAVVDEDIKFEVEVKGAPEPSVSWCKDGQQLEEGGRIKLEAAGDVQRLVIEKAKPSDSGNYSCTVRNSEGAQACFGALKVNAPPKFVDGMKDVSTSSGQDASFKIKLSGEPKPEITWSKDGSTLKVDGKHIIQKEESANTFSLVIKKSSKADSGDYTCQIKNCNGEEKSSAKLSVKEKPSFTKGLEDKTVKVGERDVEFAVEVQGDPTPKIKWYIGDMEIKESANYKIVSDEASGKVALKIKEVTSEVAGKYKCEASNESGKTESTAVIKVEKEEPKKTRPKFERGLSDTKVKEGETVTFNVKVSGTPKPDVKWAKDQAELTIDSKHLEYKVDEAENSLTLTIHDAKTEDSGKYSCTITNSEGTETTTSKLVVTTEEKEATFKKGLTDKTVSEGETVEFTVKFEGKPKPTSKWTKDGAELTIDDKHIELKTEDMEDSLTLVIHKATKEDSGKYSCTIKNSSGSDTTSSKVTVTEKTETSKFTKTLKDQTVKEEENVEFSIKFTGKPKPTATWLKNDAELTIDGKHFEYKKEDAEDSLTLILNKATKDDDGKYTCKITNSSGSDETSCKITVTETTETAKITKYLKDQTIKEEENVEFTVKFTGKPKPTAKWSKNDAELKIDGKHFEYKKEEADDSLTVVLKKATKEDSGKYSCKISNSAGSDETSCELKVNELEWAPTFLQGLKDVSVKEEQSAKFVVKIAGKPKPTVKWNKDDVELTIDGKHIEQKVEADDSLTLIIKKASKDDCGKYSCIISNSVGSQTSSGKLTVTDTLFAPEFTEGLKDHDVKAGDSINLKVSYAGKPKPSVQWLLDNSELTPDGKHIEIKHDEQADGSTLIIHGVVEEDAGKYSCVLNNSSGSKSTSGKLTVSVPPVVLKGIKDIEGQIDGSVKMNVKFDGKPEPVVTWKKDGVPLDMDGKHLKTAIEADDSLSLIIDKVRPEDAGTYECEVKNPQGSTNTSGKLSVTGKPIIKTPLEDKTALTGEENVEFIIEVLATPAPEVTWSLNGKALTSGDNVRLEEIADKGIFKMVIKKVDHDMGGVYEVEVKNPSGKATSSAKLTILEKPSFSKDLTDIKLLEGETLKLETIVNGNPEPAVSWYKGKKDLKSDVRCEKVSDGPKQSLIFKESAIEDGGTYTCQAKNQVGEVKQSCNVVVLSKKDTQSPCFITHLYDQCIVVGDAGRLEAKIVGKPQPKAKWYRNEDELKDGDDVIIKVSAEDQLYTLTLKDLKVSDSATYTCQAVNEYGEARESAILTIKEPVEPKIEGLEDVEVNYGAPARIKAKVSGFPIPEVEWSKNGTRIKPKDTVYQIVEEPETNKHAVSMSSVKENETGEFSVTASNSAGQATASCVLTVKAQAPVITKELKDQTLDLDDSFKFTADVHGYPAPTISWLKDGVPLENDSHFVAAYENGVATLSVQKAVAKDAGVYYCKASNSAGGATSRAVLTLQDFAPKILAKLPSDVKLVEGDKLVLEAKVLGQPVPEIKWFKDGKPLKIGHKVKSEVLPDGTVRLTVDAVTHDDSGNYNLVATNDSGHSSTDSNVNVEFQPKTTKPFVQQLHALDLIAGAPLIIEAKVTGNPKPSITWLKDGVPLSETKSATRAKVAETPEGQSTLNIEHATEDDAGEYTIKAVNNMGEDSSLATIKISAPGKKPSIIRELKPARFMEGESGKLEAMVSGHPQPTLMWMHNGKNVIEGKHCISAVEPNGLVTLTFQKITKEDGGQYTLMAVNKSGKAITEAPVIVVPAVKKEEEKKPKKMVEFVQGLMPVLVPEGRPCKLEAEITLDPKAVSIKWCKDGKELSPTERMEIHYEPDSGKLRLCIKQMTADDRGKYSVIVSDGKNDIKSEALVHMIPAMPGMSGNKPYFLKGLEPVKLNQGETLTLQATLPPDCKCHIKWMKDGEDIVPSDRTQLTQHSNGIIGLTIEGATMEDAGKYVVVATNDEGKTRSSAMVAVLGDGFRLPEIVDTLQPAKFLEGQPAKLEAKVDGEPQPEIKWFRDGVPLQPNDRVHVVQDPDGRVALEFDNVKPDDAGKYTMVVSNVGGETRCSAPVDVNSPPIFASPLKDDTAVDGHPAKLECKLTGEPSPTLTWLKNGVELPESDDGRIRKVQLPDNTASLVFDKCIPSDAGQYSCQAKNPYGEKASEAGLKVIGKDVEGEPKTAPSFILPLSNIEVAEGESFKLEAKVAGNPLPSASWYLGGQPVAPSERVILAFDGKKVSLSVHGCSHQHAGPYECKLSNTLGEASSKGTVSVLENQAPKFIERLSDMKFGTSEPMKLICRVSGLPKPDVEWYFNGSKLENGLKYQISMENDKCSLVLPRPRNKDTGAYECRAKNVVGKDFTSANISVSGADTEGEPAMFLKKLRDVEAMSGMMAKLTACIAGVPKPDIKWFKDGVQLSRDSKHDFEADPNGVIRLLIRSAKLPDAGTYRVSISNMFGSDTCTANLLIEGKDKATTNGPAAQDVDKQLSKTGPPPPLPHAPYVFKMCDTTLSLGWRPSIPRYPQVLSTYRLEMRRVPDGEWSTYRSGIKDSSCDVRDLVPLLDYEFRVRVENKYGVSEPSPYTTAHRTKLRPPTPGDYKARDYDIEHPPLDKYAAAPRFLRKEEDEIYAVRGQPARVEFWVYGCPQPKISWCFNNVQVESGKYDFLEDRNGQVILFISRMGDADVGFYTCKAVNEHGEAQQKIKLLIAEPPAFSRRLAPTTTMIRKGGTFTCRVAGVPDPKIKWFKDWHPLSDSSRIHVQHTPPDTYSLSVNDTILKDCGLYTCTATNIAGTATSSAMLTIEECEQEYHVLTYKRPSFARASDKPFEDHYDIGEELGRGTQGITYHAVERKSGKSFAAKVMHGTGKLMDFMTAEMDIMGQLCHPRLVRLWNAHCTKSSLTLATDICGGGELLPNLLSRSVLSESLIAQYVKQVLEGLQHMHEKNIAHLGLTIGDLMITRVNSDSIKIGDFGLATRLHSGRNFIQEYGHPEFVAPEVANKQPVTLAADMWSVGIISYLLLTGSSPFLRENDRETLKEVQKGKVNFFHDNFVVLSDEAKDFVSQLLAIDPSKRLTVEDALKHKWLDIASLPDKCDELNNMDLLKDYYSKWKSWYSNASCRRYYRRRTLESCFTHPSRMIYPPDEVYTPPSTPDRELGRSHVKPSAFDDVTFQQRIEREPIDVRSESHYQNGPDTFLLPLRDPDFPVRIRRYLKVGSRRSPILACHLKDKHWGYSDVAVKERRKFTDVMDEEIADEKRGVSRSAPLRLRHEVGTVGSGYDHLECKALRKKRGFRIPPGNAPYFREKVKDVIGKENEEAVFSCRVASAADVQYSWFRNDGILIESSRIIINKWSDGKCTLTLMPAKAYDVGVYKCVARNSHGTSVCRARLNIGSAPGKPDPPKVENCSDTEVYLTWLPPSFEGFCPTLGYALECQEGNENWTKVAQNISHEFFLVRNLTPSTTYHFRVSAVNRFGWGEFSSPSEPSLTLSEASTKLTLGKAEQYQQDLTDTGQPLILEEDEAPKLNYEIEEDPIPIEEGKPTEFYNFISEVARGRFSLVMKVWVRKDNAAYIGKACQLTSSNSERVMREYEIYKSLQHEKIACLHSASFSSDSLFLVMEKLSGINVLSYLSSKPLYSEETVSKIIHQVVDALEYLHFRSICYFELQPDNVVLVDRHGINIKFVDFGSAQYVPEDGGKVEVSGCIEYLAPEVLKGEDVHSSVDMWGVGVLTYILLSGVSPFVGDNDRETKDNVLYVRYHFDHLYKEVSQEATHFLMQLFKRTPQKRPTAEECLENKWLLPNEFMIKKREHAIFLPHKLREFSEQFHSNKGKSTPAALLNMFGGSSSPQ